MYWSIITNRTLRFRKRIKQLLLYYIKKRGIKRLWHRHFIVKFKQNPQFNKPIDKSTEYSYISRWKYFDRRVNCSTLRITEKVSGISSPLIVPQTVFQIDIEPSLNNTPEAGFISFKSIYNHWFPDNSFPVTFLHNIDGDWLDQNLSYIPFGEAVAILESLEYPVVIKPNRDTYGGKGILFPSSLEEILPFLNQNKDFLIQEMIKQHQSISKYHPVSLNTVRVYVYRSVRDNSINIINATFRMGISNSHVDNITSGGIMTKVNADGTLCGYALDPNQNKKYYKHPDTGFDFNFQLPDWDKLQVLSKRIAQKVLYTRLVGLDACYDIHGNWRMIEINLFNTSVRLSQNFGEPFFGKFSEEVYNYCKENHWALK